MGKTIVLEVRISDRDDGHDVFLDLNASNPGLCNSGQFRVNKYILSGVQELDGWN